MGYYVFREKQQHTSLLIVLIFSVYFATKHVTGISFSILLQC